MPQIVDKYECHGCGPDTAPCQVTIPHSDDKLPEYLKGRDKFIKRACLCDNHPDIMTDWVKLPAGE